MEDNKTNTSIVSDKTQSDSIAQPEKSSQPMNPKRIEANIELDDDVQSTEVFPFPVPRILPQHRSVTERYYEARFFIPKANLQKSFIAGQCLLFHSNR